MVEFVTFVSEKLIPYLGVWNYLFILICAALESNPVTGFFFPGMTLIIVGGFFIKFTSLNFFIFVLAAAFGAIIGDLSGYFLGKHYGNRFFLKFGKYFLFKEKSFIKTKRLTKLHLGKAVIFGRFNSIARSFVPVIVGSSKISFKKFMFYNVIGGALWALCFVSLGYFFGESYKFLENSLMFLSVLIIVFLLFILFKKSKIAEELSN